MNKPMYYFYSLLVLIFFANQSNLNAKLDFASESSSIVLKNDDTKLKFSNTNDLTAWNEQSIVKYSSVNDLTIANNTIYGEGGGSETSAPQNLLYNDSNAIVNLQADLNENSQAIVTNANGIYENSWAILDLDNRMEIVQLVLENSNAIIQASNAIVNLDYRIIENSNAIVNNSWAIVSLNNQIQENSWAIQNLIEHGEAIELVAQNSNAIFSASQSIAYLNQEVNENSAAIINNQNAIINNSQAIIKLNQYIIDNSNFIEDNSWSILALSDRNNQNSNAIINNVEDINENSNAIVTNAVNILYNSQAIVDLNNQVGTVIEETSNAVVYLNQFTVENSSSIITNRADIDTNTNNILYSSNAIVNLQVESIQNSNAIFDQTQHFVTLNNGKIYAVGEISGETFIDGRAILSSPIDLNGATLTNGGDILFSSQTTIASSGYLNPQGYAYVLGGDLIIPDTVILTFTSDGIIDGQGHSLIFGTTAQILIDSNVTLTLKNLTVKNNLNTILIPPVKCLDQQSKLVLDNVKFALNDDFAFKTGQIYIHDDVIFTGSSKFIYQSVLPSYIQPHSTLYFDKNTTFDYSPSSTKNDLITMMDKTASIYLNGATLQTTDTGIKLTKGQLFLDNKVTLSNSYKRAILSLTQKDSKYLSEGNVTPVAWSPNGQYLAMGGETGGQTPPPNLVLYYWNGSTLAELDSVEFGDYVTAIAWNPDGNYLAVSGSNNPDYLIVYSWNGSTLTEVETIDPGDYFETVAWSPNGKYLAGGGWEAENLVVYSWNNSTLAKLDSKGYVNAAYSVAWSPDGNYLAVAADNDPDDLIVYSWNGSSLSKVESKDFNLRALSVAWSPDGKFLAAHVSDLADELIVYSWNGSNLNQLDSKAAGSRSYYFSWSPDGKYLAIADDNDPNDLIVYSWNGSALNQIISEDFGIAGKSADWSPDGNYLAVGGDNGDNDLIVYQVNYNVSESAQPLNYSIIFGNAAKGSEYDLDVNVLSGAQVILDGVAWFDNSASSERILNFSNMGASLVLNDTNSRFKITNAENVSGWKEQSIVLKSGNDNSWVSDNTIYGYNGGDINPPEHLIFEHSNAIVNLLSEADENSNAIVTNANNINFNSQAIVTNANNINYNSQAIVDLNNQVGNLIEETSNAVVDLKEFVVENSDAIVTLEEITGDLIIQNSNAIFDHTQHFVSLNNGKLYVVGEISGETLIDGRAILSSPIDLNGATLTNGGDILFSSQTTIASSGY
ncbi:MAG: hypothetical protein ABII90_02090, partial [Bacteroidota bacterium]